jgi:uncharacterized protein
MPAFIRKLLIGLLLWSGLVWTVGAAWAQSGERAAIPALTGRVVDATQTLDSGDIARLDAQLAQIEASQGSQIVALIVATTQPEDIASYALRVAREWKIGRRDVGDGVLIIIAKGDRKLRIEVAKKLEGAIPDLAAKQVIDEALAPALRQGNYAQGISAAAAQLQQRISTENLPAPSAKDAGFNPQKLGFEWMDFFIFLFFAVPIGGAIAKGIFGNKLGSLVTGGAVGGIAFFVTASMAIAGIAFIAALLFTLISSFGRSVTGRRGHSRGYDGGGWSSGGGGWSSGGGGFSSGGGGDFGGGGASGDF